jgi:membrane-bound lytic murein transglycosylase D
MNPSASSSPARRPLARRARLAFAVALAAVIASACSLLPNRHTSTATQSVAALRSGLPNNEPLPPEAGLHGPPLVRWRDLVYSPHAHVANLWNVIRQGFGKSNPHNARIRIERAWYTEHPGYLIRTAYRAKPYLYYIVHALKKRHMPTELALLPIVESAYDPFAYSFDRATGLWQFIPSTARVFGLRMDWWYDGRRDVIASTRAALDYLDQLHQRFGSWLLALAAYNAGPITVQRAIDYNRERGRPTDYWALNLPPETEAYVPRLLALRQIVSHPQRYGIKLPPIPNRPYLATVRLKAQMSLNLAAHLLGISLRKLYLLNPGFNRWATDPAGPDRLVVPRALKAKFAAALMHLPRRRMVAWTFYRVQPGDTLDTIAARYGIPTSVLMAHNGLRSSLIRVGQLLSVPSPGNDYYAYTLHHIPGLGSIRSDLIHRHRLIAYVTPGDSLWTVAHRYGVRVSQLALWNGINPSAPIYPGQRLVVWSRRAQDPLPVAGAEAAPPAVYTVRPGDSLWSIAQTYHLTIPAIERWNHLGAGAVLNPGERLRLHAPAPASFVASIADSNVAAENAVYTVRPGNSLWSIAQAFHVSVNRLALWNHLSPNSPLQVGQQLVVRGTAAASLPINRKQRVVYTVQPGDSLLAISQRFGVTVGDLRRWNGVDSNLIYPGERLVVRSLRAQDQPTVAGAEAAPPAVYTVRPGDSLWSIAQAFHVSVNRLALWNHLSPNSPLQVGQQLVVRGTAAASLPINRKQRVVYTVQPGDSLLAISQRFGVTVGDLRRWNGVDSNLIYPGERLTVYVLTRDEDRGS